MEQCRKEAIAGVVFHTDPLNLQKPACSDTDAHRVQRADELGLLVGEVRQEHVGQTADRAVDVRDTDGGVGDHPYECRVHVLEHRGDVVVLALEPIDDRTERGGSASRSRGNMFRSSMVWWVVTSRQ